MAAGDGLISMTPTSIAYSGTSASINADGGVDFTAVTSLSLNGVFTGDYDNYLIVVIGKVSGASNYSLLGRLRTAGADATGTDYTRQRFLADNTTVSGLRQTSQTSFPVGHLDSTNQNGSHCHLYGPFLAQPTAARETSVFGYLGGFLFDHASTHSLSTSYDGITFSVAADDMTGTVHVFGYEE